MTICLLLWTLLLPSELSAPQDARFPWLGLHFNCSCTLCHLGYFYGMIDVGCLPLFWDASLTSFIPAVPPNVVPLNREIVVIEER